jgi:hypothetical protein
MTLAAPKDDHSYDHVNDDSDDPDAHPMPYGAARSPDDTRPAHRSAGGWGTSSFGQDPDEFLSETTEDDHDWRGEDRYFA